MIKGNKMGIKISVSNKTKEMLRQMGEEGETYDHIIQRLIKIVKISEIDYRWNNILEEEEFVSMDDD